MVSLGYPTHLSSREINPCLLHDKRALLMFFNVTFAEDIRFPAFAATLLLSACAGADYQPVVDMRGHSEAAYDRDIGVCQQMARTARNNTNIAEDAGLGALGGAAVGAVGGAIGGAPGLGASVGALAGLVGTGGYEEGTTENREERIAKNCMRNRGYTVLGQIREPRESHAQG
ncbi:MAG: hypothetical protein JWM91_712 [Rhodospirillales bacterium]|nr:hypothetical protein [Rhodospirillales bacterium]